MAETIKGNFSKNRKEEEKKQMRESEIKKKRENMRGCEAMLQERRGKYE